MFRSAFVVTVILLVTAPAIHALHETDHRYDVRGYVLDTDESPIADSPVTIRLGDSIVGTGTTDAQGYYRIRLHLHDSDLGKTLRVHTAAGEAPITVSFTPGDQVTLRRHYANFVAGNLVEDRLFVREMAAWLYPAGGAAVFLSVAFLFVRRHKRVTKARRKLMTADQAPRPRKRKKGRSR